MGYRNQDLGLQRPKSVIIIYGLDMWSLIYGIRIKDRIKWDTPKSKEHETNKDSVCI